VENHELTLNGQKACSVDVTLMPSGGDRVKISVGGTPSGDDAEVMVESWRKLFYGLVIPSQFTETEDEAKPDGNEAPGFPAAVRNGAQDGARSRGHRVRALRQRRGELRGLQGLSRGLPRDERGGTGSSSRASDNGTGVPVAAPGNDDRTIRMQLCDVSP
jgi:hypothetical protein